MILVSMILTCEDLILVQEVFAILVQEVFARTSLHDDNTLKYLWFGTRQTNLWVTSIDCIIYFIALRYVKGCRYLSCCADHLFSSSAALHGDTLTYYIFLTSLHYTLFCNNRSKQTSWFPSDPVSLSACWLLARHLQ